MWACVSVFEGARVRARVDTELLNKGTRTTLRFPTGHQCIAETFRFFALPTPRDDFVCACGRACAYLCWGVRVCVAAALWTAPSTLPVITFLWLCPAERRLAT